MSSIATKPLVRYLRIGWTVFWLATCILLIGLWARSYWWADTLGQSVTRPGFPIATSMQGNVCLGGTITINSPSLQFNARRFCRNTMFLTSISIDEYRFTNDKWENTVTLDGIVMAIPFAALLPTVLLAAVSPWFPWSKRFSLRTLLVFTTMVAVVLGLIVWAVRY